MIFKQISLLISMVTLSFGILNAQKVTVPKQADFYFCEQETMPGMIQTDVNGQQIKPPKNATYYYYYVAKSKNFKINSIWIEGKNKKIKTVLSKEKNIVVEWSDGINVYKENIISKTNYPIYQITILGDNANQTKNSFIKKNSNQPIIVSYVTNRKIIFFATKMVKQLPSIPMP